MVQKFKGSISKAKNFEIIVSIDKKVVNIYLDRY